MSKRRAISKVWPWSMEPTARIATVAFKVELENKPPGMAHVYGKMRIVIYSLSSVTSRGGMLFAPNDLNREEKILFIVIK